MNLKKKHGQNGVVYAKQQLQNLQAILMARARALNN